MTMDSNEIQAVLNLLGYRVPNTGVMDPRTIVQLRRFQIDNSINPSGKVDQNTLQRLVSRSAGKIKADNTEPKVEPGMLIDNVITYPYEPPKAKMLCVIVVATDESEDTINQCILRLDGFLAGKPWSLKVVHRDHVSIVSNSAKEVVSVPYSTLWCTGVNEALRQCRLGNNISTIYPIMAKDSVNRDLFSKVVPLMETNNYLLVVCDWYCTLSMSTQVVRKDSPLWEKSPMGSVLFDVSLLPPVSMNTTPFLEHNPDHATWMNWVLCGIKVTPINWTVCAISRLKVEESSWSQLRSQWFSTWRKPKISALMITGKSPERYPLARVSLDCFFDQTWSNKEMVIINHGTEKVCSVVDPRVKEVFVEKGPGITLGDMRNWSIENSTGDWCMTWDDDDWHHPTRMQNQMAHSRERHITTYMWQVRCSLTNNCAFYDKMPTGQQMSVMYERSTPARYLSLEVREDTKFIEWFSGKVVCIDNHVGNVGCDPTQYVRFYHGRNIWDFGHMMNGSDAQYKPAQDQIDLTPYHSELLNNIIHKFRNETGFSVSLTHPGPPK